MQWVILSHILDKEKHSCKGHLGDKCRNLNIYFILDNTILFLDIKFCGFIGECPGS